MNIFSKIKKAIFKKINNLRYSNQDIIDILMLGIHDILDENKIDIEIEFIDHFEKEDMELVEREEPGIWDGNDKLMGITHMTDTAEYIIIFSLDSIRDVYFPEYIFKSDIDSLIRTISWHEAYHIYQYAWLYKNNGIETVDRVLRDVKEQHYEENILEKGAYEFQFRGRVENMKEVFKKYLDKNKPVIEYLDIMKKDVYDHGRKIDKQLLLNGE